MRSYSLVDTLLLIAAGFVAVGGVTALLLARRPRARAILPAPGVERLSNPTRGVIGVALVLAAYHLAAPVFGWSGLRGPMGALAALAVIAVIGSIILDAMQQGDVRDSNGEGRE